MVEVVFNSVGLCESWIVLGDKQRMLRGHEQSKGQWAKRLLCGATLLPCSPPDGCSRAQRSRATCSILNLQIHDVLLQSTHKLRTFHWRTIAHRGHPRHWDASRSRDHRNNRNARLVGASRKDALKKSGEFSHMNTPVFHYPTA